MKEIIIDHLIGFILGSLITGVVLWIWQHRRELKDNYFKEYVDYVWEQNGIKKEETEVRHGIERRKDEIPDEKKRNIDPNFLMHLERLLFLDGESNKVEGKIKSRIYLLRRLRDFRYKRMERERKAFLVKYKAFTKSGKTEEDFKKSRVEREAFEKKIEL